MTRPIAIAVEAVAAALCVAVAALCWSRGVHTTEFAAIGRVPAFTATHYSGPWLVLATTLIAVAGLLAIDAVTRIVRAVRANHSE